MAVLLAGVALGSASGCKRIKFEPTSVTTKMTRLHKHDHNWYCDVASLTSLETHGLAPILRPEERTTESNPLDVVAGYYNNYDPGAELFPCWHYIGHFGMGAAKFDFETLFGPDPHLAERAKNFRHAILWIHRLDREHGGSPAKMELRLATEEWDEEFEVRDVATRDPFESAPLETEGFRSAVILEDVNERDLFRQDVTSVVRKWLEDPAGNHGFVLSPLGLELEGGTPVTFRNNNEHFLARFLFELELRY